MYAEYLLSKFYRPTWTLTCGETETQRVTQPVHGRVGAWTQKLISNDPMF
jgi:hypothetical protein